MHTVLGFFILAIGLVWVAYYTISSQKALDHTMDTAVEPYSVPTSLPLKPPITVTARSAEPAAKTGRGGTTAVTSTRPAPVERWTEKVYAGMPAGSIPETAGSRGAPASQGARDAAPADLIPKLQRELKRVGCYYGEIDGSWGPGSKRAINTFMERVNSVLPTDQPDEILLRLVQNHAAEVCGTSCPKGEMLADDGRCQPRAIVAHASRRPTDKSKTVQTAAAAAVKAPDSKQRAGSWTASVKLEPPSAPAAQFETGVAGDRVPLNADDRMALKGPIPGSQDPAGVTGERNRQVAAVQGADQQPSESASSQPPSAGPHAAHAKPRKAAPQPQRPALSRVASVSGRYAATSSPSRPPAASSSNSRNWMRSVLDNTRSSGR